MTAKFNLKKWQHLLALGFGSGLAPKAPGTFGTLAAVPLVAALMLSPLWLYLLIVMLAWILGIYVCEVAARDVGVHDHGAIVWDEIVGLAVTMLLVPLSAWNLLLGFVLFRFFDIVKPWPIRWLDKKVAGGHGIMLDDIVAGLMACLVLHATLWCFG
ncbi:phosphatidylglycerophosphatase A [Alkalimonas sp.]|uniref:phosphatidylglycerophosphatase A family protein n=1 Tax=Alkalimonas sp. TaxID=1872453 RepID=UPI00263BDB32|nr:phosphatidylglycerophosphatase A [Alkalimonas sp.]MCC5825794.1 phosphatidylglycerophosphatase A [Alkalimonas sp.]